MIDKYIYCVTKDKNGNIIKVGVLSSLDVNGFSMSSKYASEVIQDILSGKSRYYTVKQENNKSVKGQEVVVVNDNPPYLRSKGNDLADDNLDNLPACNWLVGV